MTDYELDKYTNLLRSIFENKNLFEFIKSTLENLDDTPKIIKDKEFVLEHPDETFEHWFVRKLTKIIAQQVEKAKIDFEKTLNLPK